MRALSTIILIVVMFAVVGCTQSRGVGCELSLPGKSETSLPRTENREFKETILLETNMIGAGEVDGERVSKLMRKFPDSKLFSIPPELSLGDLLETFHPERPIIGLCHSVCDIFHSLTGVIHQFCSSLFPQKTTRPQG